MMNIYNLGIWVEMGHKADEMSIMEALSVSLVGICVVLAELALLAVLIILLSKVLRVFTKKKTTDNTASVNAAPAQTPAGVPLPAGQSAGSLDLVDVDESTAAVIMAIVSNESGIPLNRLAFKSIKLMEEK